ncbi:MAG: efflux RND transporter permease subunit [Succinivibrio dextrinosolvens]|nr:efflux RND transporter permease subunit [Succinivibrio dextrinosolvens]
MARFFINRPIFAWVIAICIMLAGVFAVNTLPVSQYPTIAPPSVSISSSYPGADAQTVERSVTQIIEQNMTGLDGFMYMSSSSDSFGNSSIQITFEPGTNADIAQVQVQNKMQQTQSQLPSTVQQNGVDVSKSTDAFLMIVSLASTDDQHDATDISDYMEANLKEPLSRIDGVGSLQVFGAKYSMRIWLDPEKLNNYAISAGEVTNAIKAQNAQVTYGSLGGTPALPGQMYSYTITGQKRLETVEQFENILLKVNPDGTKVKLKDVAKIELGGESYNASGKYNGRPASGLAIKLSSGANALETAQKVKAAVDNLSQYFPDWVELIYPYDTTEFIEVSINEVYHTLFEAILLVIVVMYLFLQNFRATLIPSITVPVVLLGTFAIMQVLGFSINTLTMFGLVLAIGLLVDDAIVVVENVERILHEEPNLTPKQATVKSMDEITGALVGIALVLSAVFVPMAFFGGSTGIIYRQFSITIVSAMVLSVFIAIVLTPALCATILLPPGYKPEKRNLFTYIVYRFDKFYEPIRKLITLWNKFFAYISKKYQSLVVLIVHKIARYIVIYVIICVALVFGFTRIPTAFLPSEDQGVLLTMVSLPAGSTKEKTEGVLKQVSDYFLHAEQENIESVMSVAGFSFAGQGQNTGMGFIKLKDWAERTSRSQHPDEIANRAQMPLLGGIRDGLAFAFNIPAIPELGTADGFDFYLVDGGSQGHEKLTEARNSLLYACGQSKLLTQVRANGMDDTPQLKINIDYEKGMSLGLSPSDINTTFSSAWGSAYIDNFMDRNRVKQVRIQGMAKDRMTENDLRKWYVKSSNGSMVPFSAFVTTEWTYGSPRLERFNGLSAMEIQGSAAPGVSSGQAMLEVERIAKEVLPPGYSISWYGVSYQERLAGAQGPMLYLVSLLVVFLSLAALYESWSIPFAVMLVVPLGIIGAIASAILTQYIPFVTSLTNDVYFQVGLLTTVGLASKNAILIVEFAKDLYDRGERLTEAVVHAARLRFRPIIMTSMAFILGVLPLAVSSGAGAAGRNEIGICVIGGMLTATVLAIFYVPVFFVLIMRYFTKYVPADVKQEKAKVHQEKLVSQINEAREED